MSAQKMLAVVLLAFCATGSEGFYFFASTIPEAYQSVLPADVSLLYNSLSPSETAQMKMAGQNLDLNRGDAPALDVLKTMNGKLHERVIQTRESIAQKINSLHPEAKQFVDTLISSARSLRPMSGNQADMAQSRVQAAKILADFGALSEDAKRNLAAIFPEIVAGIESEEFQQLAGTVDEEEL